MFLRKKERLRKKREGEKRKRKEKGNEEKKKKKNYVGMYEEIVYWKEGRELGIHEGEGR